MMVSILDLQVGHVGGEAQKNIWLVLLWAQTIDISYTLDIPHCGQAKIEARSQALVVPTEST